MRKALSRLFRSLEYEVDAYPSAKQFLQAAPDAHPACVVLDAAGTYVSRVRGGEQYDRGLVAVLPVRAVGVDSLVALLATEKLSTLPSRTAWSANP